VLVHDLLVITPLCAADRIWIGVTAGAAFLGFAFVIGGIGCFLAKNRQEDLEVGDIRHFVFGHVTLCDPSLF